MPKTRTKAGALRPRVIAACTLSILTIFTTQTLAAESSKAMPFVDFRCSRMQLYTSPDRAVCSKNVVLRRADMWICCDTFEGTQIGTKKSAGQFDRLSCHGNVRAQRGDEVMWANEAVFMVSSGKLVLTGKPLVQRGASLLSGRRVIVDTTLDRAYIESPTGRVNRTELRTMAKPADLSSTAHLPRKCPLPARPGTKI